MPNVLGLKAAAAAWTLVSAAHTLKAQEFMNDPQFRRMPRLVSACARAGWFQGSVFFLITALLNYHWSANPQLLVDPVMRAVAGLAAAVSLGSSYWYIREGDGETGVVLGGVGLLQIWAALAGKQH